MCMDRDLTLMWFCIINSFMYVGMALLAFNTTDMYYVSSPYSPPQQHSSFMEYSSKVGNHNAHIWH